MIKKLTLIFILCNITNYTQPHQDTTIEDQTCVGPLSADNQEFITSIMHQLGISKTVKIRKPIPELANYCPILNFQLYDHTCEIWFINEEWFNTLSEQERIFMIGYGIELIEHGRKTYNRIQHAFFAASIVTEFSMLYGLYALMSSSPSILSFKNSSTKSFLASAGVYSLTRVCALTPFVKHCLEKSGIYIAKNIDAHVVQTLHCHHGALSYLKKMEETIKPLFAQDPSCWKQLYISFKPRIEAIEKLVYANS